MKLTTLRALALCSLAATLTPLGLMAAETVYFNVPFAFTVGKTLLPAGRYTVNEPAMNVVRFQGDKSGAMVTTYNERPGKNQQRTVLTFHQYGQRYFLSTMANANKGWGMPTSTQEKELLASRPAPASLGVVASTK